METIKSFTSLEQSKKLTEFFPLESADMHYNNASIKGINYVDEYKAELMDYDTAQKVLSKYLINPMFGIIPCWSLAALLNVLPDNYIDVDDTIKHPSLMKTEDGRYMVIYSAFLYTSLYSYPVNACYEMIIKLKERNLL